MSTYSWFRGLLTGLLIAQHDRFMFFFQFLYLEAIAKKGNAYVMILTTILAYKYAKYKMMLSEIEECVVSLQLEN